MSQGFVLTDGRDPAVAVISMNRPAKRNALSVALIDELRAAVDAAARDARGRVLILRGEGPVFCAGLDLHEAAEPGTADRSAEALAALYGTVCACPLVTIAAAHGAALGGGAGLVAACDLAVASDNLKLGFPEVRRGLVAALATCLLRRQLGERAVRELVLLGRTVAANEALTLGLVNRVAPADRMLDLAMELAREACLGAPGAVARSKRLLDDLAARPIAEDLRRALACHLEARNAAEAAEGVAAFLEKREPRWGVERVGDSD